MEITEGTIIKANTMDGKEVHGFVMFDENMDFFVTGETPVLLSNLTNIRITEDAPKGDVAEQVLNADIKKVDAKKVKDPEKLGADREKELIKMKVLKGDEGYAEKFAAGLTVAKAMAGKGTGFFQRSCLDKFKKKETMDNMENTSWENFKEDDAINDASMALKGDTVVGEKEDDPLAAAETATATVDSDATNNTVDTDSPLDAVASVAPITDMTVNNTAIDDAASASTPSVGDDIMTSSDDITDYSQFLDSPTEASTEMDAISTTPEEDDVIANAISDTTNTSTVSDDDVQITIKNPGNKPVEITINGKKEDDLNDEIDKEIDEYVPENGEYSDEGFFEHLCKKYDCDSKKILSESTSVSDAICKLISEVANR